MYALVHNVNTKVFILLVSNTVLTVLVGQFWRVIYISKSNFLYLSHVRSEFDC